MVCATCLTAIGYAADHQFPPRPSGPVADYAGLFDNSTKLKINALARTLWIEAGFGLIVATVPSIGSHSPEEYTAALYREWGAGLKKEPEDALVLLSVEPPGIHIKAGRGSRNYLGEKVLRRIIEKEGIPYFRKREFTDCMLNVAEALAETVAEKKRIRLRYNPSWLTMVRHKMKAGQVSNAIATLVIAAIAVLTALVIILLPNPLNRRYRKEVFPEDRFGGGAFGGWLRGKK